VGVVVGACGAGAPETSMERKGRIIPKCMTTDSLEIQRSMDVQKVGHEKCQESEAMSIYTRHLKH
jgi:hypothetical protein